MTIFVWLVSWPIGSFVNIAKSFKQTCMTLYRYDQKKRKKHWQIRILNVCTSILKYIYSHFVVYEILIWLDLYVEHWRVNHFQLMTEKVKNVLYIYRSDNLESLISKNFKHWKQFRNHWRMTIMNNYWYYTIYLRNMLSVLKSSKLWS